MKFTVELTESELKEFLKFREGKAEDIRESTRLTRLLIELRRAVCGTVIINRRDGIYGLSSSEDARKLLELVDGIL